MAYRRASSCSHASVPRSPLFTGQQSYGVRAHPNDLPGLVTSIRLYLQMRSHSKEPGVGTATYLLLGDGGDSSIHNSDVDYVLCKALAVAIVNNRCRKGEQRLKTGPGGLRTPHLCSGKTSEPVSVGGRPGHGPSHGTAPKGHTPDSRNARSKHFP